MNPIRYYEGDRIYFRPFELSDEPLLRAWVNDPANWSTLGRFAPVNALREEEWIRSRYTDPSEFSFGVVLKESDALIGSCGLFGIDQISRRAELGILIGPDEMKNRGYGTEAVRLLTRWGFLQLNLNRIFLRVMVGNDGALRSYEKAGFLLEGRCRQSFYRDGSYRDELIYAILREEYQD